MRLITVLLLSLIALPSVAAAQRALVSEDAPMFLNPRPSLTPVLVLERGVEVLIVRRDGDWTIVRVEDSKGDLRSGYVESRLLQIPQRLVPPTLPEVIKAPAPPPATTATDAPELTAIKLTPPVERVSAVTARAPSPGANAPTIVRAGSMVYIQDSELGRALAAGIVKKRAPITVTTIRDKATFYLDEVSEASKEGQGERVAKVLAFGVWAGSGRKYEASVRLTNADGVVLWAHNSEKRDIRRAAEDVSERLEEYLKK